MLEIYVSFVKNLLMGRKTKLKFKDHTLGWFAIDNGIGQGDPLSMILYIFYNTGLLDIAKGCREAMLGYVNDVALVATAKTFGKAHKVLEQMMER